jgi:glycosyltransferase involved in cell wall biosynthesis
VKLLDAMACGVPIVTTAAGAEGLPVVDGVHLVVATGAADFAEQILRLKRDPAIGNALAAAASALVEERFRAEVIQRQLASWLVRLAEGCPGAPREATVPELRPSRSEAR